MAERTNPHANLIIGAQDEASPVFDKIKASSQSMAAGVEQAAAKAGQAVDGIGAGAEKSADKFTRAESLMRAAIMKSTRELELLGKTASQRSEAQIDFKGLEKAKFQDAISGLQAMESALSVAKAREAEFAAQNGFSLKAAQAKELVKASEYARWWAQELEKVEAAEKRLAGQNSFINSLKSQADAIGKTKADLLEMQAAQMGVATQAAPFIAKMREADAGIGKMGMSAKQTAAALRQVPMQFTDIVVSLQGGQSAMQVFLQQGGQLKDLFGGVGNAARALGGYVLGLVNPYTIAAAAVAGIAVAYNQGSKEAEAFNKTLIMTGNAAGTSADSLSDMARAIDATSNGITQSKAAEVLNSIAASGDVASDKLQRYAQVAIEFERAGGGAADEVAKAFSSLAGDPLAAVEKLNKSTNFLTAEIYNQIKALEDEGRSTDAARVAQDAYASMLDQRIPKLKDNLGLLERGWMGVKGAAAEAWDSMLNVGRKETIGQRIEDIEKQIQAAQSKLNQGFASNGGGASFGRPSNAMDGRLTEELKVLRERLAGLRELETSQKKADEQQRQNNISTQAAIDLSKQASKYDTDLEKQRKAVAQATEQYSKALAAGNLSEAARAQLEKDYLKTVSGITSVKEKRSAATRGENKDLADQMRVFADLAGVSSTYYTELANYQKQRANNVITEQQYVQAVEALIKKQPFAVAIAKEQADATKAQAKASEEAAKAHLKYVESFGKGAAAAQQQADQLRTEEAAAVIAAGGYYSLAQAIELVSIKRLEEKRDGLLGNEDAYLAVQKEIDARKELVGLIGSKEARKASEDAAKDAQRDWKRAAADIERSLTDSLLRGFESGKDFAKNLRDTVVNMFKTMVLRPVISAIVNPIAGAAAGALGFSGAANAATGGGDLVGTASNIGSAYRAASGFNMGWLTNFGATLPGSIASTGADLFSKGFETVGSSMMDFGNSIAGYADAINVAGDVLGYGAAIFAAANGKWGQAIGSAVGTYFGGPIGSFIGSTIGKWADKIFSGDAGTYHTGGAAQYNAATGLRTSLGFRDNEEGLPSYNPNDNIDNQFGTGFGYVERGDQAIDMVGNIARDLVTTFDGIAKTFGKTAGYEIATAFADDSSKDGAWGALRISKDGQELLNWENTRQSKWAPREFANGEDGYKEYLAEIAKDTRTVLLDMDLPSWADTMLESIGDAANMEQLSAAIQQIGVIQTTFVNLGRTMEGFAGLTDKAFEALMRASGGLEALSANAGTYYENFYSEAEKTAAVTRSVSDALAAVGLQMPATRDEFRALVESQLALGEEGAKASATLLGVSGAFASVVPAAEQAAEAISQIMQNLLRDRGRLEADLLRAQGNIAGADAANRLIDIAGYTEAETALYDYNAALRSQIEALEQSAEAAIRSAEAAAEASRIAVQAERDLIAARAQSAQDAYGAAQSATNAAMQALERSVGAQRTIYESARSAATDAAQEIKSVIDTIAGSIKDLYGEVDSTMRQSAAAGMDFVANALQNARATGYLPDSKDLSEAIAAARTGMGSENYASQFEADRARLVLAGQLSDLGEFAQPQLTAAEQAVKAAEGQLEALEAILRNARDQVDAARGIDTTLKTIPEALASLQTALVTELQAQTQAFLTGIVSSLSSGQIKPQDAIKSYEGKAGEVIPREQWVDLAGTQSWISTGGATALGGTPTNAMDAVIHGKGGDQFTVRTAVDYVQEAMRSGNLRSIYDAAVLHGISSVSLDSMMGWPSGTSLDWAKSQGLPAFAVGTNYVPQDMAAIVHKGEAIIPAAYNPAAGGVGGGNAEVVAELRALRLQNERLEARLASIEGSNKTMAALLDDVTDGGNAMRSEVMA